MNYALLTENLPIVDNPQSGSNIPSNIQPNEFTVPIGLGIFAIIFIVFLIIAIIIISTFYSLEYKKHKSIKEFTKSPLKEKEQELICKYRALSTQNKNVIDDTINALTNNSISNDYQNDGK